MNERRRRPRRRRGRRGNRSQNPQTPNQQTAKQPGPEMMVDEEPDAALEALHSVSELVDLRPAALLEIAQEVGIADKAAELTQQNLIFEILKVQAQDNGFLYSEGVLEVLPDGYGFLRAPKFSYLPGTDDVYVSPSQIRRFALRTGDTLSGTIRKAKPGEKYFALVRVDAINFDPPGMAEQRKRFKDLTPLHPNERIRLELGKEEIASRVLDLLTPLGFGQRAIIVSPPRAGKTLLLQTIARSLDGQSSRCLRPRAVDRRAPGGGHRHAAHGRGEVIASTFDEPATRHVAVGRDRHGEGAAPGGARHGRGHPAGLDHPPGPCTQHRHAVLRTSPHRAVSTPTRWSKPKRFFGAARNIEEGGSLTIIATALVETGSRMDEVIFEEFKGTGNMEIVLDRKLADKRIFPAIDINRSGTRKEELLLDAERAAARLDAAQGPGRRAVGRGHGAAHQAPQPDEEQ